MECRKKPFPWNTANVARSPFRTLQTAKKAEKRFRSTRKIGFTAKSSLKSMGRIPRSSGCYQLGNKYKNQTRFLPKN
jgi:hypothetical protein